jgi:UDP-glucose 4-epimerase
VATLRAPKWVRGSRTMRTLVTGGAGFIGSTLVDRLLTGGHEVDVVDDLSTGSTANLERAFGHGDTFRFRELDLRSSEVASLIEERRPEVVFHLAAQISVTASMEKPLLDAEVNVMGSLAVLEAARASNVRKIVFAASGGTLYGDVPAAELPLDEDRPHQPQSPYGLAKMVVCRYLDLYRDLYGLEYTALALANVFGPRQDPHGEAGVVAIFAKNLVAGVSSTIYGDGLQTRDFVYVDDVVDAFVKAAVRCDGKLLNIGTGIQTSVNELYDVMSAQVDQPPAAVHAPGRPGEVIASALDGRRAMAELDWKPRFSLEDGSAAVVAFERARL